MKRLGLLEKFILTMSVLLVITGIFGVPLVIYNGVNGYGAFDFPDKKVSIRIKNENINIRSEGSVRSRGANRVLAALDNLGEIAKERQVILFTCRQ